MTRELFCGKGDLSTGLQGNEAQLRRELGSMTSGQLENAGIEELTKRYFVQPLVLDLEGRKQTLESVKIDVSHDFLRGGGRGRGRLETDGVRLVWTIPFRGDADIWHLTPSSHSMSFPRGAISRRVSGLEGELTIDAETPSDVPEVEQVTSLRESCEKSLRDISIYVERANSDVEAFNARLPEVITSIIEEKTTRAGNAQGVASALGAEFVDRQGL